MASQPSGPASNAPSWMRGARIQPRGDAATRTQAGPVRACADPAGRSWPRSTDEPTAGPTHVAMTRIVAQAPRSAVQAATQASWSLHVVAASVSAQSACGVVQYQILLVVGLVRRVRQLAVTRREGLGVVARGLAGRCLAEPDGRLTVGLGGGHVVHPHVHAVGVLGLRRRSSRCPTSRSSPRRAGRRRWAASSPCIRLTWNCQDVPMTTSPARVRGDLVAVRAPVQRAGVASAVSSSAIAASNCAWLSWYGFVIPRSGCVAIRCRAASAM